MDSFFDYIIIIFFVVSALASLFKKKKPPVETDAGGDFDPEYGTTKTDENLPYYEPANDFPDLSFDSEISDPEPELQKKSAHPSMQDRYKEILKKRKAEKDLSDSTQSFEKEVAKSLDTHIRANNLKDKLKDPETFKEYFIISEILNKPVGLRDNG